MIKVSITGKMPDIEKKLRRAIQQAGEDLNRELKEGTPVDTGYAKSRWNKTSSTKSVEIKNDAPYIEPLDKGSSKQAPNGITKPAINKIIDNFKKGKYTR